MRPRTSVFLTSLSLALLATCACKRTATEPDSLPGGQTGTVTATIDGTPWAATTLKASQSSGVVFIQALGALSGGNAVISLVMPSSEGTYTLGLASGMTGAQSATLATGAGVLWSADSITGNGSLTLTSLSSTRVTGTCFMSLAPNVLTGASGTRVIASGVFDVSF